MTYDGDDILMTLEEWLDIDVYEYSNPTNPSPGRIFKRTVGQVCVVTKCEKPGHVGLNWMTPEFIDQDVNPTHRLDGHWIRQV